MARDGSSAGSRAAPGSARRSALIHCAMRSSPTSFWMPGCRCAMYKRPPPCGPADHDAAGREGGPRQPGPARHVYRRVHRGRSSVTRTGRQFHLAARRRGRTRPGRAMHHHSHAAVTGHSVKGVPEPLVGAAPRPQFRQAGGQQIRMFCAPAGWCGWPRLTARSVAPVPAGACWCSGCAEPVTAAAACAGPAAGGR